MFSSKKHSLVLRATAAVLVVALLSGCKTQKVEFTSIPPGATVVVGKKKGITPCTLKIKEKETHATFSLPSGAELILPLPRLDSDLDEAAEASGKVLGGSLMVVGGVVAGVGAAGVFLVLLLADDDDDDWPSDDEEDYDEELEALGYSAAILVGGALLFGLGKWIYPDNEAPVLHAEFGNVEFYGDPVLPDEDPRYEDPGYGARRLKKAVP